MTTYHNVIRVSAFETRQVRSDCACRTLVFPHPVIKLRRLAAVARGATVHIVPLPTMPLEAAATAAAEAGKAMVAPAAWVDRETSMPACNAAWSGEEAGAAADEAGEAAVAPAAWVACTASMPASAAAWLGEDSAAADAEAGKAEAWAASMPEAAAFSAQAAAEAAEAVVGGAANATEDGAAESGKAMVAPAAWVDRP